MLKPEMIEKLNEQMKLELYSSLLYQQMSAWCSYHTFEGAAAFLRRQDVYKRQSIDSVTGVAICNEEQPTVVAAGCGGKKR